MRIFVHSASILIASSLSLVAQGPLTPPGPPAPTMKTLEQVEARTPVNAANTPGDADCEFIISQPGSYYLTGNINAAKTRGVRIAAPNVTLDLNGFEIRRTASGGVAGVEIFASLCTVKNGSVSGFLYGLVGTNELGGGPARGGTLLRIAVSDCELGVFVGNGWRLESCTAVNNILFGFYTQQGAVIRDCIATNNPNEGIHAGGGSTLINCTATGNKGTGIVTDSDCTIESSTATSNERDGLQTGDRCVVRTFTANRNGNPSGTTGSGINAGIRSLISGCKASLNRDDGINAGRDSVILDNHASLNGLGGGTGTAGIQVGGAGGSRVEGNHARENAGTGILATTADIVIRNTAGGNTVANFNPASGANFGPLQTAAGATSPTANHQF